MDFFEHQEQAQRNTVKLLGLMLLAVVGLILAVTAIVAGILYYIYFQVDGGQPAVVWEPGTLATRPLRILSWGLLGDVAVVVGSIIALGSGYKILQLRSGGHRVAEAMGGRLLNVETGDADEKQILNVVEEIAIASGMPVPPVYLLEDDSINALAAGFRPQDAVIGITRGCIRLLNRDELQGVIAHEFSHILNGDMRLNIRLVGIVHGILMLGMIGYHLTGGGERGRAVRTIPLFIAGLAFVLVGALGTLFGNLIKASVSRQREFLADAAAVQFTRNPEGIAGALKKIGGSARGSVLRIPHAAEFSHMYFSQGVRGWCDRWFATHPPLSERVIRIEPGWDGEFPPVVSSGMATQLGEASADRPVADVHLAGDRPAAAFDDGGLPKGEHNAQAQRLLAAMPPALRDAAHDSYAARALVYSLLLDHDNAGVRERQWWQLRDGADPAVFRLTEECADEVRRLERNLCLPLLELSFPALKSLSPTQSEDFRQNVASLIYAGEQTDLFKWALYQVLIHGIVPSERMHPPRRLKQLKADAALLLAGLADAVHDEKGAADRAYRNALMLLRIGGAGTASPTVPNLLELERALQRLNRLRPRAKSRLLAAMALSLGLVDAAGPVPATELYRAIAARLDCPFPPFLPEQQLS